jgi:hypothetical protein
MKEFIMGLTEIIKEKAFMGIGLKEIAAALRKAAEKVAGWLQPTPEPEFIPVPVNNDRGQNRR